MGVNELSLIELEFIGEGENQFSKTIKNHIDAHDGVTFIDLLKFLYQSVLGAHHIFDMMKENEIGKWVERNLNDAKPIDNSLTEKLYGKKWVRIDLGAFKKKYGNNHEKLLELFLKGKKERRGSVVRLLKLQDELMLLVKNGKIKPLVYDTDLMDLVDSFVINYRRKGCPPLRHSKLYNEKSSPYLVLSSNLTKNLRA